MNPSSSSKRCFTSDYLSAQDLWIGRLAPDSAARTLGTTCFSLAQNGSLNGLGIMDCKGPSHHQNVREWQVPEAIRRQQEQVSPQESQQQELMPRPVVSFSRLKKTDQSNSSSLS